MNDFDDLVSEIQMRANLHSQEATGFYAVNCPVCQKKPKKTGGFRFETDAIIYNCFRGRCDATCVYTRDEPMSRKFKHLLSCIGVTPPPALLMIRNKVQAIIQEELDSRLYVKHGYDDVDYPDGWELQPLNTAEGDWPESWRQYLAGRSVIPSGMFYINAGEYAGNVLIPFRYGRKLIGWHILTGNGGYVAFNCGNTDLIYFPQGFPPKGKVLLVEGTLDAKSHPSAVGVLRDRITPQQAYLLKDRDVIMLPDRSGGNKFIDQFHDYGWSIAIPEWDVKDLNAAVCKYGLLAATKLITESVITDPLTARVRFDLWRN